MRSKVAVNHQHIPSSHSITSSRSGFVPLFQTRLRSSPSQWRTFIYFTLFAPTAPQIQSITVEDMRQFLQCWERPDSAVLGIVGDFQPAQVRCAVLCHAVPC